MTDAPLVPVWAFSMIDSNGDPISGAKLYCYEAGSVSTSQLCYQDSALTTAHTNPIVADSAGRFATPVYAQNLQYKFVLKDASDVTLQTIDPWSPNGSADFVTFTNSGTGATTRTVKSKLEEFVSVKDFGAVGDGATDDTAAVQAALDEYTKVYFPSGTYLLQTVTFSSGHILEGDGHTETILKLKNSTNDNLLEVANFDTLTGSNSWIVSTASVPHGCTIRNMGLNGNSANNTSGDCIKFYGKRQIFENLHIWDAPGNAIYAECANATGQTDYRDMPEGRIANVWIKDPGAHGIHYRGPHDGVLDNIFVSYADATDARGVFVDTDGSTYNGACDIGNIHCYGCFVGFESDAQIKVHGRIQTEGCTRQGTIIASTGNVISQLFSFNNNTATGYANIELNCAASTVSEIHVVANAAGDLLTVTGNFNTVGSVLLDGGNNSTTGILNQASNLVISGHVTGVDTVLKQDKTGGNVQCQFNLTCAEVASAGDLVNIVETGEKRNQYNLTCYNAATIEVFDTGTGQAPDATSSIIANVIANSTDLSFSQLPPLTFGLGGPQLLYGTGTPEGAVTADVGSYFVRSDGSSGTSAYVKESGTGNTGWAALITSGVAALTQHGTTHTDISGAGPLEFTSIPSGVQQVTVVFSKFSSAGAEDLILQLGDSTSYKTTGYTGRVREGTGGTTWSTSAQVTQGVGAGENAMGSVTITKGSGNKWHFAGVGHTEAGTFHIASGWIELSSELTRLRANTSGGSNFDGGTDADIILYYQ